MIKAEFALPIPANFHYAWRSCFLAAPSANSLPHTLQRGNASGEALLNDHCPADHAGVTEAAEDVPPLRRK